MNNVRDNKLIMRQLSASGLASDVLPQSLGAWMEFLVRINKAYAENEQGRYLMERSLLISSNEMQDQRVRLDAQLKETAELLSKKLDDLKDLLANTKDDPKVRNVLSELETIIKNKIVAI